MSISVDGGKRGGKKSLTAELNLVPYIDLLTCMVAFLLITAVWTQLSQLNVKDKGTGGEETGDPPMAKIELLVGAEGFHLSVAGEAQIVPKKGDDYDFPALLASLKKAKQGHPDKDDVQIAAEDSVLFDPLAQAMDTAISAGFPLVSLTDSGAMRF